MAITLKQALMTPISVEQPVWTAKHPKTGKKLLCTYYTGHWYDNPNWMGIIHGLHPKWGIDKEFKTNKTYGALDVIYWELPDAPCYLQVGLKKVPGSAVTYFISSAGEISIVEVSEVILLYQSLNRTKGVSSDTHSQDI